MNTTDDAPFPDHDDDDDDLPSTEEKAIDTSDMTDPAEGLYAKDGELDPAEIGRRVPALTSLLRTHEDCFDLRIETEALAECLASEAGSSVRDATADDDLEAALRELSRDHLHEIVEDKLVVASLLVLQRLADDTSLSRKRRRAAAAGVALTGGLPDAQGVRGRGLLDLLLRVTLEELHAQEMLRRRAAESVDGLSAKELEEFWDQYPALRHRLEERYRKEVEAVLEDIEGGVVPAAVSVDLAVRGAHRLLEAAAAHSRDGTELDGDAVRDLLATTFESDLLDGGRGMVVARWKTVQQETAAVESEAGERLSSAAARAIRIVGPGSPAGEMVLFHVYMRAVMDGSFYIRDEDEAAAAREVFGEGGLRSEGVLAFADFLRERGDVDHEQRVLLAGIELWPDHEGIRDAATRAAAARMEQARRVRHGPTYEELGEVE